MKKLRNVIETTMKDVQRLSQDANLYSRFRAGYRSKVRARRLRRQLQGTMVVLEDLMMVKEPRR